MMIGLLLRMVVMGAAAAAARAASAAAASVFRDSASRRLALGDSSSGRGATAEQRVQCVGCERELLLHFGLLWRRKEVVAGGSGGNGPLLLGRGSG